MRLCCASREGIGGGGSVDYIPRKHEVAAYNTFTGVRYIDNVVTIDPFIEIILQKGDCVRFDTNSYPSVVESP